MGSQEWLISFARRRIPVKVSRENLMEKMKIEGDETAKLERWQKEERGRARMRNVLPNRDSLIPLLLSPGSQGICRRFATWMEKKKKWMSDDVIIGP